MKGVQISEDICGSRYVYGESRYVVVTDWLKMDEETGFFDESALKNTIIGLAEAMVNAKFKDAKHEEQMFLPMTESIMMMQSTRVKSKKLLTITKARAISNEIIHSWLEQATKSGYFNTLDPKKLADNVEESGLPAEE